MNIPELLKIKNRVVRIVYDNTALCYLMDFNIEDIRLSDTLIEDIAAESVDIDEIFMDLQVEFRIDIMGNSLMMQVDEKTTVKDLLDRVIKLLKLKGAI